jgi:uncharacterized membrane protein
VAKRPSKIHFFPLALSFVVFFFLLTVFLISLNQIRIPGYAYEKIGIDPRYVFVLLMLSILGSYINIPVAKLPAQRVDSGRVVVFFGMRYVVPGSGERHRTIIAVNVGGAVIPVLLSLYLLVKHHLYVPGLLGIFIMVLVVRRVFRPVPAVGIAVPIFVPPLIAVLTSLVLSRHSNPPLAYIAGSIETLTGADLLNWKKIRGLGAHVASIGGAGAFDGIFLTGILSVLLV